MPAVSTTLRVLAVSVIASLTVTGCQTLDDTGRTLGRSDLINDLATRLDESLVQTWTAEYRLPGGRTTTIAQAKEPARSAYTWAAGKITVSEQAITRCATTAGRTACTVEPPVLMSGKAAVPLFAEARKAGLITPPAVIRLLTEAALDPAGPGQADRHHDRRTPRHLRRRPRVPPGTSTPASPPTACSAASPVSSTASRSSWPWSGSPTR